VILSVTVGWGKLHPQIFTAALSELGIQPRDAVFVGDSYLWGSETRPQALTWAFRQLARIR
jgi:hypothetical protein